MLTNGNGKRRRGDFLGMSEVSTAPYTFAPRYGFLRSSATAKGCSSAVISPPPDGGIGLHERARGGLIGRLEDRNAERLVT